MEQGGALEQVAARIKRVMGLTFELTGPQRRDGLARAGKMYRVPQAGPRQPAVGGPVVQRGVRRHPHLPVLGSRYELAKGFAPYDNCRVLCEINAGWYRNHKVLEGFDVTHSDHAALELVEVSFGFNELG